MKTTYYALCESTENIPPYPEPPEYRIINFKAGSTRFEIAQPVRALNNWKPGKKYLITVDEQD